MFKIAALIWVILATTLGGVAVIAIVATPQFAERAALLIPSAFIGGVLVAIPLSYLIAKRIARTAQA